jgi:hypothetical protein
VGRSAGAYMNLGDLQRDLMGVKSHPTKKKRWTYLSGAAFVSRHDNKPVDKIF